MLVTERPGRLRVVGADGKLSAPVAGLPAVLARGQGGLLDVALDPAFAKNNLIYWSFSEPRENNENNTAVARGKFVDDAAAPRVDDVQVIYHQTPSLASTLHFGSRLVFGRDGTLFVTQGDRSIIRAACRRRRWTAASARSCASTRRIDSEGQPVRRQGRRASRDLVVRPPQHPGGGAPSRDRRAVGNRARHARRRRDQHRAQGQGLRLADDRLRHRIPGRARSPAASSSRPAWSSRSITGIRSSGRAA